jgi:hypothetical protein
MKLRAGYLLIAALSVVGFGCTEPTGEDTPDMTTPTTADMNAGEDMASPIDQGDTTPDMKVGEDMSGEEDMDMAPPRPEVGSRVDVSFDRWMATDQEATARALVGTVTESELLGGDVALGRVGDYYLENEHGRYIIETEPRAMSPCPYGGNVVDAAWFDGDAFREDNLGEICLLINVGQTFKPVDFEIIQEGSEEEPAILAVTGPLVQHDFLNFNAQVRDYLPPSIELPIDLNAVYPATVTTYYILQPGARALQVVTAMRNDGEEQLDMVAGHLVASGGVGSYFNPLGGQGGFGSKGLSQDNLSGYDLPYMLFNGATSSYGYVPDVEERLQSSLPISGVHLTEAGAVATLLRRESLSGTILIRKSEIKRLPGAYHLLPGESDAFGWQLYVSGGDISNMLDHIYPSRGIETGTLTGVVRDTDGEVQAGAKVSAVNDKGLTLNQAMTDADGNYEMVVPVGEYTLLARKPGQPTAGTFSATVVTDQSANTDLSIDKPALLEVTITDPDGLPVPGRLTVLCDGACPGAPTSQEMDVTTDSLPSGYAAIIPAGVDGIARGALPAGDYRVVVSRGMEWSVWPSGANASGGMEVTLTAGEQFTVDAEIAHVVRTPGVVSGDFHIHSLTSTDSPIGLTSRVLDFMTEGVDVMVSTDHDYITDFAPAIEQLGAQEQIVSVIGEEITTSDAGHINAFPLEVDPEHRRQGALDWGNGEEVGLALGEIFDWIDAFPGEQVAQINHPDSTIGSLLVDPLIGISYADPVIKRLPELTPDPETGDTRLWAENFTAMEIYNGKSVPKFFAMARWWMTMIGRGFSPTGTAVTDTHKLYSDLGGAPRSFIFVGEGFDTPSTFDNDTFATAINQGKLIGSNGPFFSVTLANSSGQISSLGEVLDATEDGMVEGMVHIELPEWIQVDTVDIYTNREDVITNPGETSDEELVPDQRITFSLDPQTDLEIASEGNSIHRRWVKDVPFTMEVERDAYVIVIVRARSNGLPTMHPVVPGNNRGFAFSNPLYIDADGGGWDDFPLAELAAAREPMAPMLYDIDGMGILPQPHVHRGAGKLHHHHHHHDAIEPLESRVMTEEELLHFAHSTRCNH